MRIAVFRVAVGVALVVAGYVAGRLDHIEPVAQAQGAPAGRVFELRTYTTNEGKLATLNTRFRDHTLRLFTKFNMTNIGYWTPQEGPLSQNTLIYIIAHPSREAAKESWAKFQADPEWVKVRTESEVNGKILVKSPESVFLVPTDYSPIK